MLVLPIPIMRVNFESFGALLKIASFFIYLLQVRHHLEPITYLIPRGIILCNDWSNSTASKSVSKKHKEKIPLLPFVTLRI